MTGSLENVLPENPALRAFRAGFLSGTISGRNNCPNFRPHAFCVSLLGSWMSDVMPWWGYVLTYGAHGQPRGARLPHGARGGALACCRSVSATGPQCTAATVSWLSFPLEPNAVRGKGLVHISPTFEAHCGRNGMAYFFSFVISTTHSHCLVASPTCLQGKCCFVASSTCACSEQKCGHHPSSLRRRVGSKRWSR